MENAQTALETWCAELQTFHLPRWQVLPEFELYMDQIVTLTNQHLAPLFPKDNKVVLTNSMVNNYVKQKTIAAPVKKRYNRGHLAQLIMLTILKQVITLPEISTIFTNLANQQTIEVSYNQFCTIQEDSLYAVLQWLAPTNEEPSRLAPVQADSLVLQAATLSFSSKMVAELLVAEKVS